MIKSHYKEFGSSCENRVDIQFDCMKLLLVYARHLDASTPSEVLDPVVAIPSCRTALASFTLVNDNYHYD